MNKNKERLDWLGLVLSSSWFALYDIVQSQRNEGWRGRSSIEVNLKKYRKFGYPNSFWK
jgi:hypothetical protein